MSSCSKKRWGPGTTCERPINTEASKDFRERLAKLEADRAKQDLMWITSESQSEPVKNNAEQVNPSTAKY